MPIAPKIRRFPDDNAITYEVRSHPHTGSSQRTAEEMHVSGLRLAKAVLLERDGGEHVLAVLPASREINDPDIGAHSRTRLRPFVPDALHVSFPDCEPGALPPFGTPYGLKTIVATALLAEDPVYFEAGDDRSVVRIRALDFRSLLFGADFFAFSSRPG